jgi:radical SAM superfamily enzyme YgiQ (UPF0313 family)
MIYPRPPIDVWLCDLTHTQQTIASNTIPLAIGMIAAYLKKHLGESINIRLFKYPEKLVENLLAGPPRLLGFSNYVWNLDLSYSLAARVKSENPETVVVFGGPNYPQDPGEQEAFLKRRPAIDFYLFREGEPGLLSLLQTLLAHNFDLQGVKKSRLPNVHYLAEGIFQGRSGNARLDLQEIPSPYTGGLLDEFFDGKLMPLVQTNRGCPFSCTFCERSNPFFNKVFFRIPEAVIAELEYIAQRIRGTKNIFIADSNFGMYPQDLLIAEGIARVKKDCGFPDYIHVATGKNVKERVLEAARLTGGLFRLSASVQSTDPQVLKNIKRQNISQETIMELAKTAGQIGSNTYAEVILALPGDSKQAHFKSLEDVLNAGLNFVRCFTLMLLKGTELDSPETITRYGLVAKYRVLPRCYGVYQFGADEFIAVETEKVCVANNTLTFEEYLECRLFALTIDLFYNDGIFSELLTFLSQHGIKPYDFLKKIYDRRNDFPNVLADIYEDFRKETIDELWDSEEELLNFAKRKDTIQKYLSGEYGSNLIYKYRATAFIKYMQEIHELSFTIAKELIMEKPGLDQEITLEFFAELMKHSLYKKINLLETGRVYEDTFKYDLLAAETGGFQGRPQEWLLENPKKLYYYHDPKQQETIDGHRREYGTSIVGIGRILTKVHIKKMYRQVQLAAGGRENLS